MKQSHSTLDQRFDYEHELPREHAIVLLTKE